MRKVGGRRGKFIRKALHAEGGHLLCGRKSPSSCFSDSLIFFSHIDFLIRKKYERIKQAVFSKAMLDEGLFLGAPWGPLPGPPSPYLALCLGWACSCHLSASAPQPQPSCLSPYPRAASLSTARVTGRFRFKSCLSLHLSLLSLKWSGRSAPRDIMGWTTLRSSAHSVVPALRSGALPPLARQTLVLATCQVLLATGWTGESQQVRLLHPWRPCSGGGSF